MLAALPVYADTAGYTSVSGEVVAAEAGSSPDTEDNQVTGQEGVVSASAVNTGDTSNIIKWCILMLAAVFVFVQIKLRWTVKEGGK